MSPLRARKPHWRTCVMGMRSRGWGEVAVFGGRRAAAAGALWGAAGATAVGRWRRRAALVERLCNRRTIHCTHTSTWTHLVDLLAAAVRLQHLRRLHAAVPARLLLDVGCWGGVSWEGGGRCW